MLLKQDRKMSKIKKNKKKNNSQATEENNAHKFLSHLNVCAHKDTHTQTLNLETGPQRSFTRKQFILHR